ncbi:MAG: beta-N-acetylhexosaminidase [Elusimicrobia bacterium]|nr:beta-N-acetylhexosaminidase [Elusimicrobiota bacterium]
MPLDPGFVFMFGIYGKRPNRETIRLLRQTGAASILLLARNIDDPRQLRALTRGLVQAVGRPLLFAVDHEGGWVLRFRGGLTAFPGNAALGRVADPALAYATGRQMALELAPLGIGMNLAPVLDVAGGRYNPGIGIRSFGSDPALVGRLGTQFVRGLQDHGVAACVKHFPGKGAATVDAHVSLPTIRLSRAEFFGTHLAPFAEAGRAGAAALMTSHMRCPALDARPASFSRRITHGLVRGRLKFRGAVISDDLCMGAVTGRGPVPQAALDAFLAGHDIVMIAHDPAAQREAVELFHAAGLPPARLSAAAARIRPLLRFPRPGPRADARAGARLALRVARLAAGVARAGAVPVPLPRDGARALVLFPDFREVAARFTFEPGPLGPLTLVREAFRRAGGADFMTVPMERAPAAALRPALRRAERVIFFCFEAMRFAGQRAVLDLVNREAAGRAAACLLRGSCDLRLLDRNISAIDAHGYRLCQLQAACELLLGREP